MGLTPLCRGVFGGREDANPTSNRVSDGRLDWAISRASWATTGLT